MDSVREELMTRAAKVVARVFNVDSVDLSYFPMTTGGGGFYTSVICRQCYKGDMYGTNGADYNDDGAFLINLRKRGTITDNITYPPKWYEIRAGKCYKCGKITFGLRAISAPERSR